MSHHPQLFVSESVRQDVSRCTRLLQSGASVSKPSVLQCQQTSIFRYTLRKHAVSIFAAIHSYISCETTHARQSVTPGSRSLGHSFRVIAIGSASHPNQWRIQGGFLVVRKPPPAMIFFLIREFTSLHAPTFTSHLNLRLLETPLETNSGYATANPDNNPNCNPHPIPNPNPNPNPR